jgi:hypothetical protein
MLDAAIHVQGFTDSAIQGFRDSGFGIRDSGLAIQGFKDSGIGDAGLEIRD